MSGEHGSEEELNRQSLRDEVGRLVTILRDGISGQRRKASIEIGYLAVKTRAASRSRGSVKSAQRREFPGDYQSYLKAAEIAFKDANPEVRREVAYTLGEWGDDDAVEIVRRVVSPGEGRSPDPETIVRTAATRALGRIGGREAVRILGQLATDDPSEDVRFNAISGLASLAEKERREVKQTPRTGARVGGAFRSRGTAHPRREGDEAENILRILEKASDESSWYVRARAKEALADLRQ